MMSANETKHKFNKENNLTEPLLDHKFRCQK